MIKQATSTEKNTNKKSKVLLMQQNTEFHPMHNYTKLEHISKHYTL